MADEPDALAPAIQAYLSKHLPMTMAQTYRALADGDFFSRKLGGRYITSKTALNADLARLLGYPSTGHTPRVTLNGGGR